MIRDVCRVRIGEIAVSKEHVAVNIHVGFAGKRVDTLPDIVFLREGITVDVCEYDDRTSVCGIYDYCRLPCNVSSITELYDIVSHIGDSVAVSIRFREIDVVLRNGRNQTPIVLYNRIAFGGVSLATNLVADFKAAVLSAVVIVVVASICRCRLFYRCAFESPAGKHRFSGDEIRLPDDEFIENSILAHDEPIGFHDGIACCIFIHCIPGTGEIPLSEISRYDVAADSYIFRE